MVLESAGLEDGDSRSVLFEDEDAQSLGAKSYTLVSWRPSLGAGSISYEPDRFRPGE